MIALAGLKIELILIYRFIIICDALITFFLAIGYLFRQDTLKSIEQRAHANKGVSGGIFLILAAFLFIVALLR